MKTPLSLVTLLALLWAVPALRADEAADQAAVREAEKSCAAAPETAAKPSLGAVADDVLSALVNLGYPRPVAQKAVENAAKDAAAAQDFEKLFRAAMAAVK